MMDPIASPRTIIDQLNAFCQADIKSQWTPKRLKESRDVCGFSYVENETGEWGMIPVLCSNCQHTLECLPENTTRTNKSNNTKPGINETKIDCIWPSPLIPENKNNDTASTEYLLYPPRNSHVRYNVNTTNNPDLEFYRPSLASSINCCRIL